VFGFLRPQQTFSAQFEFVLLISCVLFHTACENTFVLQTLVFVNYLCVLDIIRSYNLSVVTDCRQTFRKFEVLIRRHALIQRRVNFRRISRSR